jgi:acyl carrier protein
MTDGHNLAPSRGSIDAKLRAILADVLGLDAGQVAGFDRDSGLFGHLPELDSMAVAGLLTEMEDRLGIVIDDDDVDGEMLETYGGLLAFAEGKAAAA